MSKKKPNKITTTKEPVSPRTSSAKNNYNTNPVRKRNRSIYLVIFLISFLLYGNTIPNKFAMDDELVTLDHPLVSKGIAGIPEIMSSRYVQNDQQSYEYRPIVLVTYAIEHQFTEGNVHFSHFVNIILYALTGILLFTLLSRLFITFHWILPASITFLFLIHPIHSEVVASLKNRDELLSFLFTLLSIISVLNYYDKSHYKHLIFGLIYFLLAMFSKKSALPLLITLPIILYYFRNISLKKGVLYLIVPALTFWVINFLINKNLEAVNRPGMFFENPYYVNKAGIIEKLPMVFYSMGYYVKLMFIPYPLLVYYGYSYVDIAGWGNVWAIISAIGFIGLGIYCILNFTKKNILIFGFLYFTINIGAFSNLAPMPGIIADRFSYGASLGFCIIACYGIFKLLKINIDKDSELKIPSSLKYGITAITLVCSVYIFQRNKDWKDHLSIYLADYEKAPNSAKINALIGGYCMQTMEKVRSGKSDTKLTAEEYQRYIALSKKHFTNALKVYPDYIACLNNMGTLYYSYIGELDSARMYFEKVLKLDPEHVQASFNLGSFYEVEYSTYSLMEKHYSISLKDSVPSTDPAKKYNAFIEEVSPIYRAGNLAYTDLTRQFQQFIDDSRNSGGKINPDRYINGLNSYWQSLVQKLKLNTTQTLAPGADFINAITSSTLNNPTDFANMLRNEVNKFFVLQFETAIFEKFEKIFNRKIDQMDKDEILAAIETKKLKNRNLIIERYNTAIFAKNPFPPAYQKLSQLYMDNQMWDSLIQMNQRVLKTEFVSRYTDVYRQMGTGYFYSKREKEGIKYFEMSIAEEVKILKKAKISLQQLSASGNNVAVQKMNQLVMGSKMNLVTLYQNTGAMYQSIGDESKAVKMMEMANSYK